MVIYIHVADAIIKLVVWTFLLYTHSDCRMTIYIEKFVWAICEMKNCHLLINYLHLRGFNYRPHAIDPSMIHTPSLFS